MSYYEIRGYKTREDYDNLNFKVISSDITQKKHAIWTAKESLKYYDVVKVLGSGDNEYDKLFFKHPVKRKVELFRLLDGGTWDSIIIEIDPETPEKKVRPLVEKMIDKELIGQAQHRRAILIGILNIDMNEDERSQD